MGDSPVRSRVATLLVDPAGALACAVSNPDLAVDRSLIAEGVPRRAGVRAALFCPTLAIRTNSGFTVIVATGGYAGTAL